jgi:hypothetical protein
MVEVSAGLGSHVPAEIVRDVAAVARTHRERLERMRAAKRESESAQERDNRNAQIVAAYRGRRERAAGESRTESCRQIATEAVLSSKQVQRIVKQAGAW